MRHIDDFEIVFENDENGFFRSGTTLCGKVLILVSRNVKVESIILTIKGKADARWTAHRGKTTTTFYGEETYFDYTPELNYLERCPNSELFPGVHEIPFTFWLPEGLPSSFEGCYGSVRYACFATLSRPTSMKQNVSCSKSFMVIGQDDLNRIPLAHQSAYARDSHKMSCCFKNYGVVDATAWLPKRGFVPGELVCVQLLICNSSRRPVHSVDLRLKQNVTYFGQSVFGYQSNCTASAEILRETQRLDVLPAQEILTNIQFRIPTSLFPSLDNCRVITAEHLLKIDVGSSVHLAVPLIIGTVPIHQNVEPLEYHHQEVTRVRSNATQETRFSDSPPPYTPAPPIPTPPPSYRESFAEN